MIKIIYKSLITLVTLIVILLFYLSIIGIKTDIFNSKIISQIKLIEPNIEINLNDVSARLDLLNFGIQAKTIGTDIKYKNKIIKIETIKSNLSIKSYLTGKFALNKISISTKSLTIKDVVAFLRLLKNDSKFFIAERIIKNGFLVADLKLEFDEFGNVKKNFVFNGLIRDGRIDLFKKYFLSKIDFNFQINEKNFEFLDFKFQINNKDISIPQLKGVLNDKGYLITGKLNSKNTALNKNEIEDIIIKNFFTLNFNKILFNSNSNFQFELSKNFKVKDLIIESNINIKNLGIKNFLNLKKIFPEVKKDLVLTNQELKLKFKKNYLSITGRGNIILQKEADKIEYKIFKKNDEIVFSTKLNILNNSLDLDFLNYKKNSGSNLEINIRGKHNIKGKLVFNELSLKENNNVISVENLILSKGNKIDELKSINLNFIDKDDLKNDVRIIKKQNDYLISGNSFNFNNIIDKLLKSENKEKLKIFNNNFTIDFDIMKIYLNKDNSLSNLRGFLYLKRNEISELNLFSKFSNQENIKFTIKDNGNEKITTLYSYKAKPFVDRYDFIKGFEEGDLDFYSVKKNGISNSLLKIDNFKIQEIPALAKLLTLASLQGIADLLTGEGIRFTDFEMKFSTNEKLMNIEELYAIGPAISILMEGYIQKKKIISLRGTLVPATTINRTISSIPLIGDILVGKKVGEGVFGVSFKIKGPPGRLETTVNPVKTLTPRFITRTLEKIKKAN